MTAPASPASRLRELAARAVLGADRASGSGTAESILRRASVEGRRGRAGWRGAGTGKLLPECAPEERPPANAAQAATLARLVSGSDTVLLDEWAELADARGVRIPEAHLPAALDHWARASKRPECVRRVVGRRGEWLTGLNPAWGRLLSSVVDIEGAEERWELGTPSERATLLARVRAADPARARAMVEATWKADGAEERRRFVEALREGLSVADEQLLERALDERSKVVRAAAAGLLADLPGSRLAGRMRERTAGMVRFEPVKKGLTRKKGFAIAIEPPKEYESEWERDGVEEKPPTQNIGKRAWWLRQIVAMTDPEVFTPDEGPTPEQVLGLVAASDHAKELGGALVEAAAARGSVRWREAAALHAEQVWGGETERLGLISPLWAPLAPDRREALLTRIAAKGTLTSSQLAELLCTCEHPMSPAFSQLVLETMADTLQMKGLGGRRGYIAPATLRVACRRVDPTATLPFIDRILAKFQAPPEPSVLGAIEVLRLRADMHKEFGA